MNFSQEVCQECKKKFASIGIGFELYLRPPPVVGSCRFCGAERSTNEVMITCIPVRIDEPKPKPRYEVTGIEVVAIPTPDYTKQLDRVIELLALIAHLPGPGGVE